MSPTAQQAIDEHMVKFKGQHAMKQYMAHEAYQTRIQNVVSQ